MKISYILQLKDFSIMIIFGFLLGIIYGILNIFNSIKPRLFLQILTDIIFSILASILFIILVNKINMGEIRLFLITGYIIGFILERISLGKLFAKLLKNMYTFIIRCIKSFSKSKFGRMIFK